MAQTISLAQQAVAAHQSGNLAQAETLYRAFLTREPNHPVALHLLGTLLHARGRTGAGLPFLERAAALLPLDAEVHNNLGVALNHLGRFAEAARALDRAVSLVPDDAAAQSNLGAAYRGLHRFAEARGCFARALALRPDAGVASNLGLALLDLGEGEEAAACFRRATELDPAFAQAHVHLASTLLALGRLPEALASIEAATALDPAHGYAVALRAHLRQALCDWRGFAADREALSARAGPWRADEPPPPFTVLALTDDPEAQLRRARAHAGRFAAERLRAPPGPRGERVRVAYLSPDFRQHPVAVLMADVLACHDRARFEVHAVSFGPDDGSALRARIRDGAEHFLDVRGSADAEVAALLRARGIDVAVDLAGFTTHSRPGILAPRPARIQVNYLGYPGSTGADWIDYAIGDAFVAPEALQGAFSEAIVRLPGAFQANGARPAPPASPPRRAAHGLPAEGLVFGAFSASYKLTPDLFAAWMRLLRAVPGSVLWLVADHAPTRDNLRREAGRHGVDPDRLVLAGRAPYETYLDRLRHIDLFLDTFPYNAGTTASDALWMGVPLLTLAGRAYASRMAGSLLTALGLPDLVAASLDAYERQALRLADPERLADLRGRLAARRHGAGRIFDAPAFARRLEAAFRQMVARADRGLRPAPFAVPEPGPGQSDRG
ncbi:Tetratricopeptide TPR_2 repeat protein [Methylobacterium sp. 4-46]|uniref:O-linked N-acetylglucosamine transferase, SPINDLY family protein n=1 Tax=unclassified Methylobacterium TaxID=2615210 RepID=UPI000165C723|nr:MULTISPECIES: tetratricopeptide repeat protein [Methylobacterium]ACA15262.1 Tetratricopeptide TPR_2 repeat protein [Methylobacterium sp. 4-46]WFT80990.1 tetratricopeptide repeat protein [Methylobacterium nodulans]